MQSFTWATCDGGGHLLPGHYLLCLYAIVKNLSKVFDGSNLVTCSGMSWSRWCSRYQPSVLGATADMPVTLPYQRSSVDERAKCARYLSTTRCVLPHLHLELELEAGRPTVLPLYAHSRLGALGVVSQQAEIQQRAAPLAAEVERRGRAPPPRIRFEHASSILWCWCGESSPKESLVVRRAGRAVTTARHSSHRLSDGELSLSSHARSGGH
jgi:hypothetical protein